MVVMNTQALEVVGMHETLIFPELDNMSLQSKTDTGAYNSAIDCSFCEERADENGKPVLAYILLHPSNPLYTGQVHYATSYKTKKVRSSNGIVTTRYQIKMTVQLLGRKFKTTFNLSNRAKMRYAILVGRRVLSGRFMVDVAKHKNLKTK